MTIVELEEALETVTQRAQPPRTPAARRGRGRTPWLALVSVLLAGCPDLDAQRPECFEADDACPNGQRCVAGACQASGERLMVVSALCLGAPGGACEASVTARVGAQSDNACLVWSVGDEINHAPLSWTEGRLRGVGGGAASVSGTFQSGQVVSGTLYLLTDEANVCRAGGLTPDTLCGPETFCVLRLVAAPIEASASGDLELEFAPDGTCAPEWAAQSGRLAAPIETCEPGDQDCDGQMDEGVPQVGARCEVGIGACLRAGQTQCTEAGVACDATPARPEPEQLDGLDNDCDGMVDEGLRGCDAGESRFCGVARGVCAEGLEHCSDVGEFGPCVGADREPVVLPDTHAEACNGLDDDCDGMVDEGLGLTPEGPFVGEVCGVGQGICRAEGRVVCTPAGIPVCNAVPGAPRQETCDSFDDDCDGRVDEGFGLGDACTPGIGACRREGEIVCKADGTSGCSVDAGAPAAERCGDSIDNDCDEQIDEGFDAVGQPCEVGVGACAVVGRFICAPQLPTEPTCDLQPLPPRAESCNGLDDDCDGQIDEDFDLATDPQHCGRCNAACAFPNAEPLCAARECALGPCAEGFLDLDGRADNGCECNPALPDEPDPSFTDTNCDGVDGRLDGAVFVSVSHGSDDAAGTAEAPLRTVGAAVVRAAERGHAVYLDQGRYPLAADFQLVEGVHLHGGYQFDPGARRWTRAPRELAETLLDGGTRAVLAHGVAAETMVDNLVIQAADAPPGQASIALAAVDSPGLVLRMVTLRARQGGAGASGELAASGEVQAVPGAPGFAGDSGVCPGCGGPGGGNPVCGPAGGGDGGDGGSPPESGEVGEGDGGGAPGGAVGAAPNGGAGVNGEPGLDGAPGLPADVSGAVSRGDGRLSPVRAGAGNGGRPGGGGGGGGAGLSGVHPEEERLLPGGGGGGGGAGGCPGSGATGGQGGGASIALLVVGEPVELRAVRLIAGPGGRGGNGGAGGAFAPGAPGGRGGTGQRAECPGCGNGGDGGDGGRGGCGGHGAGGEGGASLAVLSVLAGAAEAGVALVALNDEHGAPAAGANDLRPGTGGERGLGGRREGCGAADDGADGARHSVACCSVGQGEVCGPLADCRGEAP